MSSWEYSVISRAKDYVDHDFYGWDDVLFDIIVLQAEGCLKDNPDTCWAKQLKQIVDMKEDKDNLLHTEFKKWMQNFDKKFDSLPVDEQHGFIDGDKIDLPAEIYDWRNSTVRNRLLSHGFKWYAGERDSLGWLTAVIERNGKKMIYG